MTISEEKVIIVRANDANGRQRNRLEVYGREWAAGQGVPVPRVVDHDPNGSWMVTERVQTLPPTGADYVDIAMESAQRIEAGEPPRPVEPATTWRHPNRWRTPLRAFQLASAGISPLLFIHARRSAAALPSVVPSHFDYHPGNVLHSSADAPAATIIDFEYLRMGPRYADAIRLFTTLESHADAAYGVDWLLQRTPRSEWPGISAQLRWLALRPLAELITVESGPPRALLMRARERWRLAQQWVQEIDRAYRQPNHPPSIPSASGSLPPPEDAI